MRNEELGMWLNGFPNNLDGGHVTSQQPSTVFSNGFRDNNMINDVDVLLANDFSRLSVFHEQGNVGVKTRGYDHGYGINVMDSSYTHAFPHSHSHSHTPCSYDAHSHFREENIVGTPSSTWGVSVSSDVKGHTFGTPMERNTCYGQVQLQNPFHVSSHYSCDDDKRRPFAIDCEAVKSPFMFSQQSKLALNVDTPSSHYFPAARERATRVTVTAPNSDFSNSIGDPVAFQCDGSFILQEKDVKCCAGTRGCNCLWGCNESLPLPHDVGGQVVGEEVPQFLSSRVVVPTRHEKNGNSIVASDVSLSPRPLLYNFDPLVKFQGYIYHLAKDQNGCRSLQRMVDEGTSEEAQIVFNGVIDDVVELMMDPFGNYLVQKLVDVCGEDQRLQIVCMLTKEPGLLVKTSLNTHGTRVVQKLIAIVNCRKQIAMLRSAIQPGFLVLIKDLNGNHVIQRCLQYFSCKDNEKYLKGKSTEEHRSPSVEEVLYHTTNMFIFDAATKFCVDIATHQHGCCVLQRCIDYSTGKYQEKLVKEICKHGLILAQDPFGNYVVQYIIEMENPSASSKLHSQFKGNYVNLSMQKFSSHVVEKCLIHVAESRSRIVQELLSFPRFEQLLPDPYANYVVQRALAVSKGSLHASLVEAVRPHKILRTSPYCKRIFSRNLLTK